ncbi:UNVERIFIED_CONTAM: hypothetical protein FKN15_056979 [Acipenser sinensis]
MFRKPPASLHAANSPSSRLRATASEDNAALGSLQASPQAPGQTTGVAGARTLGNIIMYFRNHTNLKNQMTSCNNQKILCHYVLTGLPEPNRHKIFEGLTTEQGFYTSKDFLLLVSRTSKAGMCGCRCKLPVVHGTVPVLGACDTAFDCATSALRCGARPVFVIFRKGFTNIRAVPEEVVENLGMCGCRCKLPVVHGTVPVLGACDTAFDCATSALRCGARPVFVIFRKGFTNIRAVPEERYGILFRKLYHTSYYPLYERRDKNLREHLVHSNIRPNLDSLKVKEAMTLIKFGDGVSSSWIQRLCRPSLHGSAVAPEPQLLVFYSPIDLVCINVEMAGLKFPNPFGLALP